MLLIFFFFKQKTAYELRISDWSSDVCSSDLMCSNSYNFFVKSVGYGDYDGKNCGSKAGTGAGRFETDSRYVHQEHRVHPKYAGDLRAEPDRVQRMGHPARRHEQGARREDA